MIHLYRPGIAWGLALISLAACSEQPAAKLPDRGVSTRDLALGDYRGPADGKVAVDRGARADAAAQSDSATAVDQGLPAPACTKTIGPGTNIGNNVGGPGSVLCLESGVYNQAINVDKSGNAQSPITIRAAPGASPIIDGQDKLAGGRWEPLVGLNGDYIVVEGLEIRNSDGRGVILLGTHNTVRRCKVHHIFEAGIYGTGDDSTIEYNEVWETARVNVDNGSGSSGWPTAISAARDEAGDKITNRVVIRGNISHDNWGEGIDSYEAEGTLIEGNIVYNNWSVNLYVSDSRNVIVRNNIVYNANPSGGRGGALTIADELSGKPRSSNVEVTNNIVYGTEICQACWTLVKGLSDINVHHNTIVKGALEVDLKNGSGLVESANCIIDPSEVPGLGTVTPGSLNAQLFKTAKCPAGSGADISLF